MCIAQACCAFAATGVLFSHAAVTQPVSPGGQPLDADSRRSRPVDTAHSPGAHNMPSPEFRPLPDGGLAIRYAVEAFIDQHHCSFDIEVGRVNLDRLTLYRHLFVWREYDVRWRSKLPRNDRTRFPREAETGQYAGWVTRHVQRYEHASLSDFLIDPDGKGVYKGPKVLRASSAWMQPMPDAGGWIIVSGLQSGTLVSAYDDTGKRFDYVYGS